MIQIVCTDKGRHRSQPLQWMVKVDGVWCEVLPDPRGNGWDPGANVMHVAIGNGRSRAETVGTIAHRIECWRCGRDTRVNPAKLAEVLDMIDTVGECLDMSRLPF